MSLFETGMVAQPDGREYAHFNCVCSLVSLPCGSLFAVFNGHAADGGSKRCLGVYSSDEGRSWTRPEELFSNGTPAVPSGVNERHFADPVVVVVNENRVLLFAVSPRVKKGPGGFSRTVSWRRVSVDGGVTFGPMEEMVRHRKYFVGTTNPGVRLRNGKLVLGYSWDIPSEGAAVPDGEGEMEPCSGVLISDDEGVTWRPGADVRVTAPRGEPSLPRAIAGIAEPAVAELPDGRLFLLGRTGTNHLWQSFSADGGYTWQPAAPSALVSHNCPAALLSLEGDGATLAVYNNDPLHRAHLSVTVSRDGCRTWSEPRPLGSPEFAGTASVSYPGVCELSDGTLLCLFAQRDDADPQAHYVIRSVRFDRAYCGA